MFVVVVPAVRSIRGKDEFVYSVTDDANVAIGQIVQIPWRSKIVPGIVWKTSVDRPSFPTKPISELTTAILPDSYLQWIEWFSSYYYVSKSHVAKMALPDIPKRIIIADSAEQPKSSSIVVARDRVQVIQQVTKHLAQHSHVIETLLYTQVNEILAIIRGIVSSTQQNIAIIVSEEHQISLWENALRQYQPVIIHSRLSKNDMYAAWQSATHNPKRVYIGTRRLSLFPFSKLDTVFIVDPENPAHKQWDLNPRYSVPRVVQAQLKDTKTRLVFCSQIPTVEMVAADTPVNSSLVDQLNQPATTLIDMTSERFEYDQTLLSRSVWQRCRENNTIFLWFNKKGTGSFLICKTCDELLPDVSAASCPNCKGLELVKRGLGTTSLTAILKKNLPDRIIIELTKDTGDVVIPYDQHPIIVGTTYAESQLDWRRVQSIIVVSIDQILSQPDFRASEIALQSLVHLRNRVTDFVIQTYAANHPVFKALNMYFPEWWYQQEIEHRQEFFLPPFGHRIWLRNTETNEERIIQSIEEIPTASEWIIDREL